MPDLLHSALVLFASLIASTLAAVTGFGGAAVLLPVLVATFGVREAIPILTVAQLVGNGSRVWFNRRELNYRVVAWFALGGVPLALLGGLLFAKAPLVALTRVLGVFLIQMIQNSLILVGIPSVWQRTAVGVLLLLGVSVQAVSAKRASRKVFAYADEEVLA